MMKKFLLLSLTAGFLLFFQTETKAQQTYQNAIGIRLGAYNGLNFKTFLQSDNALDFNLSFRNNNNFKRFIFTGLYEVHNNIDGAPGLKWYYGGGGSLGSIKRDDENGRKYDGDLFLSADGVLGLDYKIDAAPINLSLDWRPRLELTPNTDINAGDVGLAIRFTF